MKQPSFLIVVALAIAGLFGVWLLLGRAEDAQREVDTPGTSSTGGLRDSANS
jgi:hypothetical protein